MNRFDELKQGRRVTVRPETQKQHLALIASMDAAHSPRSLRGSRVKRYAVTAAAAAVLLGAGVGTAAAFGAFTTPTERGIARCYTTADLNDEANYNSFAWADRAGSSTENGDAAAAAMDVCSAGWSQGRFSAKDPKVSDPDTSGKSYPVPELTPCVLESGAVGVFPGAEGVCADLGLNIAKVD